MLRSLAALRITAAKRRASSRPILVETSGGTKLVKLRGAAQGVLPLAAEVVVAGLARALGLNVPAQSLIAVAPGIETADWDDELADLLDVSVGTNLGFDYLPDARDATTDDLARIPGDTRARILWLDRLVLNPDRNAANPNLLWWREAPWLIDHGATLGFLYRWPSDGDPAPRDPWSMPDPHLFEETVTPDALARVDAAAAQALSGTAIPDAVLAIPDAFLPEPDAAGRERRRASLAGFLHERLAAPRPFLDPRPPTAPRVPQKPSWLLPR